MSWKPIAPFSEKEIVRQVAKAACERICRRLIRRYRHIPPVLLGDDSPLRNYWEDICVQEQQEERALDWEAVYEASLLGFLAGEVDELDDATRWAIWRQTDAGVGWSMEDEKPAEKWSSDEIAKFILFEYLLLMAQGYSNERLRKFIERSERTD